MAKVPSRALVSSLPPKTWRRTSTLAVLAVGAGK
jgi:hypothetical protein